MDLVRRIFTWLRGDNVIVDPERAIANETASEATNLEPRISDSSNATETTCNCRERIASLEKNIERLTSWVHTLRIRIDRNDADLERTIDYIRSRYEVEYSPTYVNQERESIPEQFIQAPAVQENIIEPPIVPNIQNEQNQNQRLNGSDEQPTNRSVPQEVSRTSSQPHHNRTNSNVTVAQCYNMDYKNRGLCVIFSHEMFKSSRLSQRHSATKEARMIQTTFQKLGYRVQVCQDYTFKKIKKLLRTLKELVQSDDDSICICISTHGDEDILWARDCAYSIDIFENTLANIGKLIGKPKKIFIQACRGKKIDRGLSLYNADSQSEYETDNSIDSQKYPSRADFLIVHSTTYGYVSWRDWFFMAFCHMLDRYSEVDDIDEILRKTMRKVCTYESRCTRAKQVPAVYSTLTKKLFLKRK